MIRGNSLRELQKRLTDALDRRAGMVTSGALSPAEFFVQAQELVSFAHSRAAVLGTLRAKRNRPPTDVAIRVADAAIRSQQEFLFRFAKDLAAGRYKKKRDGGEGASRRRMRFAMYAMRLGGTANEAWLQTQMETFGNLEVRWTLGSAEHCATCLSEAAIGWRNASTLHRVPGDGSTICIVRCRCHLETRDGAQSYIL